MSLITLQVGQCGNQIGAQLFDTLANDLTGSIPSWSSKKNKEYCEYGWERFFNTVENKGKMHKEARAIMVDMEPKVIAQTMAEAKHSKKWCYPEKQNYCQKRGSGNNWAHGYCVHGSNSKDIIMDMVRTEVEKCDNFDGFLVYMSLAGGTGSGVGAYLSQCLKDEYPHSLLMNQVVWPYNTGEVIVQNYNAVLTMAHLYQNADALIVMENDQLQNICTRLLGIPKTSFRDINRVIAHKMATILMPAYDESSAIVHNHLGDLLSHLVSHPEYKLLTIQNIPQISERSMEYSTFQWRGLLKHLRQMLIAKAHMEEGIDWNVTTGLYSHNKSVANLLLLRGKDIDTADWSAFQERRLYTSWMPHSASFQCWTQPRPFQSYEKSASLVSNSQAPIASMDHVIGKAWNMFASRAYVHQYVKHGLTEEDFVDSFATLEQIVASYKKL